MADRTLALVTGGNGFIGSHLVKRLLREGISVRALVLPGSPTEMLLGCEIRVADITRPETLNGVMEGVSVVFHLAALARDYGRFQDFLAVNVGGTQALLQAAIAAGVSRFVFMSSLVVHDLVPTAEGSETTPLGRGINAYARSKILAEELCRAADASGRIRTTIVRPGFFPFGPEDRTSFLKLAGAIGAGKFALVGGGRARLATAYVENLVDGVVLAGLSPAGAGETFVIGDPEFQNWKTIADSIARALGVRAPRLSVPAPLVLPIAAGIEQMHAALNLQRDPFLTRYRIRVASTDLCFSSAKAERVLGYRPRVGFAEGIERSVAWVKRHLR
jgi:nucleoside-diphosphate-sugar epimerase